MPLGCADADDAPRPDVGVVVADAGVPLVGGFIFIFIGEGRGGVVMIDAASANVVLDAVPVVVPVAADHLRQ